jgi:hypothetical protein
MRAIKLDSKVTMLRFIAGILACLLAQAVGLDNIKAGLHSADRTVRAAYTASVSQLHTEGK